MTIQCLTFDLDDTLWDVHPVIIRAEKRFYEWLATHYPHISQEFDLNAMVAHRQTYFTQFEDMRHDFTWLRKKWLAHLATEYQCPKEFETVGFEVFHKARNEVEFYDGVIDMMEEVAPNYTIISITNGNADVNKVGLGKYFDFAVTAAEVGAAKPDPRIFQKALELGKVQPENVIHIGDDPVRDVNGAAVLGMKTIWVNTHRQPWPGGDRANSEVIHISQLSEAIKSL